MDKKVKRKVSITRDFIRSLDKLEFSGEENQIEFSDITHKGLKLIWYPSGKTSFLISFVSQKKRFRKILGDTDSISPKEAIEQLNAVRTSFNRGDLSALHRRMAMFDLCDKYLEHSQKSKESYRMDVSRYKNHLKPHMKNKVLSDYTKATAKEIYTVLKSKNSLSNANHILNLYKAIFTFAKDCGYIADSPFSGMKIEKPISGVTGRPFTEEESKRICKALLKEDNADAASLLLFLFLTGLRFGEASKLLHENVSITDGIVSLHKTKAGEGRTVTLSKAAIAIIAEQARLHGNTTTGLVFRGLKDGIPMASLSRLFKRVCIKAEVEPRRVHDIRHTVATRLAATTSIYSVMKILGHKQIATTQIYAQHDKQGILKALNSLSY